MAATGVADSGEGGGTHDRGDWNPKEPSLPVGRRMMGLLDEGNGGPQDASTGTIEEGDEDSGSDHVDFDADAEHDDSAIVSLVAHTLDDEHKEHLEGIFHHYCAYGDFMNRTQMARGNWQKMAQDMGLCKSAADGAKVNVMFSQGLKFNTSSHSEAKLSFDGFLYALARMVLHLYADINTSNCLAKVNTFVTGPLTKVHSAKADAADKEAADQLLAPGVLHIWKREESLLRTLFGRYATAGGRAPWEAVLEFGRMFALVGPLISQPDLFRVFTTISGSHHDHSPRSSETLDQADFTELIGRVALKAFGRPAMKRKYDTVPKRVNGLFDWLRASPHFEDVKVEHRKRAASSHTLLHSTTRTTSDMSAAARVAAVDERMEAQSKGAGRRMSRINMLLASGDAEIDVKATGKRRASVVHRASSASPQQGKGDDSPEGRSSPVRMSGAADSSATKSKASLSAAKSASQVDQAIVERVFRSVERHATKLKGAFEFYCRIDDPANPGLLTERNFIRLCRDCDIVDDYVTPAAIHLQFVSVAKNKILDDDPGSAKPVSKELTNKRAIMLKRQRSKRRMDLGGGALNTAAKLDLTDFVALLVRISELIRSAQHFSRVTESKQQLKKERRRSVLGSYLGQMPVLATGEEGFKEGKRMAENLIRLVAPLSKLSDTEDGIVAMLSEEATVAKMNAHENLIQRFWNYYVDAAGGGKRLKLQQVLRFVQEFEVVPQLLAKGDVMGTFYATARSKGTDAPPDAADDSAVAPSRRAAAKSKASKIDNKTYLTYDGFKELIGRMVLLGMSKPFLDSKYPTTDAKVVGFFQWCRSSGRLAKIEVEEWERGLSRRGQRRRKQLKSQQKDDTPATKATPVRKITRRTGGTKPTPKSKKAAARGKTLEELSEEDIGGAGGTPAGSSRLLSTMPGVPPPPPLTEAQKKIVAKQVHFDKDAPTATHPVSLGPEVDEPLRAVQAAIDALTGALDGTVDVLSKTSTYGDADTIEGSRVSTLRHAVSLKRVALALRQLVASDVSHDGGSSPAAHAAAAETPGRYDAPPSAARSDALNLVAHEMVGDLTRDASYRRGDMSGWGEPSPVAPNVSGMSGGYFDDYPETGLSFNGDLSALSGSRFAHGDQQDFRMPQATPRSIHPGEDVFVARLAAARMVASAKKKQEDSRLPESRYTGQPTQVREFVMSPSRAERRRLREEGLM